MTTTEQAAPCCPRCGQEVRYDLTCHSYPTRNDQGREVWMSCMPCDSARLLMCYGGDDQDGCGWHYTYGLNPDNPRAANNEANRPDWLNKTVELDARREPVLPPGIKPIWDD